ncbi:MAG TPA: hypothetical protein ENH99_02390 [Candidatus Pacearchaeota archaeon]|nr:hypothetical protein [Candidatus Pacearchaeota archaeon]
MIKLNKRELVKALALFAFLASGFFIYLTVLQYIPIILMLAALVTESKIIISHIPMFIKLWYGFNLVFLLSAIVILLERMSSKTKVKNK